MAYTYGIGKYEVSRSMIEKANSVGTLGITLQDMGGYGGNGAKRPATGINWYEAAKFVNWLNTSSGGTAAYKFDGSGNFQLWSAGEAGYDANNLFRNSLARYWLPSRDEWYKAAYGNSDGTWNTYTTGNNTAPTSTAGGTDPGTTVFGLNKLGGPTSARRTVSAVTKVNSRVPSSLGRALTSPPLGRVPSSLGRALTSPPLGHALKVSGRGRGRGRGRGKKKKRVVSACAACKMRPANKLKMIV